MSAQTTYPCSSFSCWPTWAKGLSFTLIILVPLAIIAVMIWGLCFPPRLGSRTSASHEEDGTRAQTARDRSRRNSSIQRTRRKRRRLPTSDEEHGTRVHKTRDASCRNRRRRRRTPPSSPSPSTPSTSRNQSRERGKQRRLHKQEHRQRRERSRRESKKEDSFDHFGKWLLLITMVLELLAAWASKREDKKFKKQQDQERGRARNRSGGGNHGHARAPSPRQRSPYPGSPYSSLRPAIWHWFKGFVEREQLSRYYARLLTENPETSSSASVSISPTVRRRPTPDPRNRRVLYERGNMEKQYLRGLTEEELEREQKKCARMLVPTRTIRFEDELAGEEWQVMGRSSGQERLYGSAARSAWRTAFGESEDDEWEDESEEDTASERAMRVAYWMESGEGRGRARKLGRRRR